MIRTLRELLTEPDAPYVLNYAQPFYEAAALNLMALLVHFLAEPKDDVEVAERIRTPMSEAEFEERVAPLRPKFLLDGEQPRFMQGSMRGDPKKQGDLSQAICIAPAGDRQFLFRTNPKWAIPPEESALFLFARTSFFEGAAGKGYKKGTSGDNPIRAFLLDEAENGLLWLRRTVWLNVLSESQQRSYANAFSFGEAGYDSLFHLQLPKEDLEEGEISLRAGLAWLPAWHWLWYEDVKEPGINPLTGDPVVGRAARMLTKSSTGVMYGKQADMDNKVKAERLFRHPNVPMRTIYDKKSGNPVGHSPCFVSRMQGLTQSIGACFFGGSGSQSRAAYTLPPVVGQFYWGAIKSEFKRVRRWPSAWAFGFHMLTAQRSVHGGVELSRFALPQLDVEPNRMNLFMEMASEQMRKASMWAESVESILKASLARASGAGVRATMIDGAVDISKVEPRASVDEPYGRDVLFSYWASIQELLIAHGHRVARAAEKGVEYFSDQTGMLQVAWEEEVERLARSLFMPAFEQYSVQRRTMPFAHNALKYFSGSIRKIRTQVKD